MNYSRVRGPEEWMTVIVNNLTAFTRYNVTITAFTGPRELAATDGKSIGPIEFQTLEEGMCRSQQAFDTSPHSL